MPSVKFAKEYFDAALRRFKLLREAGVLTDCAPGILREPDPGAETQEGAGEAHRTRHAHFSAPRARSY